MPTVSSEATPTGQLFASPEASPSSTPSSSPEGSPSNPSLEEIKDTLFPGLEEGYTLSGEEMECKKKLQTYLDSIKNMEEGIDFTANTVLVQAATKETAEVYAKAFGGYVKEYAYGLVVVGLNQEDDERKVTVA